MRAFSPEADERSRLRIKNDEASEPLCRRHIPVVTQPDLEGEIRPPFVSVLDEEAQRALRDAARLATERHAERVCCVRKKRRNAREVERARP